MGVVLLILGIVLMLGGTIGVLVAAFRENLWWGLGSLVFVPVMLVFIIMHWQETKKPFFAYLAGVVLMIAMAVFAGPPAR